MECEDRGGGGGKEGEGWSLDGWRQRADREEIEKEGDIIIIIVFINKGSVKNKSYNNSCPKVVVYVHSTATMDSYFVYVYIHRSAIKDSYLVVWFTLWLTLL